MNKVKEESPIGKPRHRAEGPYPFAPLPIKNDKHGLPRWDPLGPSQTDLYGDSSELLVTSATHCPKELDGIVKALSDDPGSGPHNMTFTSLAGVIAAVRQKRTDSGEEPTSTDDSSEE